VTKYQEKNDLAKRGTFLYVEEVAQDASHHPNRYSSYSDDSFGCPDDGSYVDFHFNCSLHLKFAAQGRRVAVWFRLEETVLSSSLRLGRYATYAGRYDVYTCK
jgi:hypothetical protein